MSWSEREREREGGGGGGAGRVGREMVDGEREVGARESGRQICCVWILAVTMLLPSLPSATEME